MPQIEYDADNLPKPEAEILAQIQDEITQSRNYVSGKRETFRERLKLYNNQRKQRDKIGDTTMYNIINTMLAVSYTDEQTVTFSGREIGDLAKARLLDYAAKFDHEEMGLDMLNYLIQWDRFFFGVGIRTMDGWDKKRKVPVIQTKDPLCWLPDPAGHTVMKYFRWMGFEDEYTRSDLTEEAGFFDVEKLSGKTLGTPVENALTRTAHREAQGMSEPEPQNTLTKEQETIYLINHMTQIKCEDDVIRKFLITVADDLKSIHRFEWLKPVTKAEKEDNSLVPFAVALNYYSPSRYDAFGVNIGDLTEDKQRAKSVLKNLRIAARKAKLYPMYLYNRDKILNRRDLDFAFNKFIAIRGQVDDGVVQPLNKDPQGGSEAINDEDTLDRDVQMATGADQITQGVTSANARTLGEVQQTQANANLRFMLGARINAWGEKRFWKLWYRAYLQNFAAAETKHIRIRSSFGLHFSNISRKDFITSEDPDIQIMSKLEAEQKRMNERVSFQAVYPLISQDPSKPVASKRFAERYMLRLNDMPEDYIAIVSPDSPDEIRAKMENELLTRNQIADAKLEEDHLSHLVIHSQADETDAKANHIQKHWALYYESGQAEAQKALVDAASMGGGTQAAGIAQGQAGNMQANMAARMPSAQGVTPTGPTKQ